MTVDCLTVLGSSFDTILKRYCKLWDERVLDVGKKVWDLSVNLKIDQILELGIDSPNISTVVLVSRNEILRVLNP